MNFNTIFAVGNNRGLIFQKLEQLSAGFAGFSGPGMGFVVYVGR